MGNGFIAARRPRSLSLLLLSALGWVLVTGPHDKSAQAVGPSGDYQRAVLVTWDGVRRDVLFDLLYVSDPTQPCWEKGTVFPVPAAWPGAPAPYTCLPGLGGARPWDAAADQPAYPRFQMLASHTTNDGNTMTKPQHASILTGLNTETHGITLNETTGGVQPGVTIYEILMDALDPPSPLGVRNGYIFRTLHAASRKYVGSAITRWAARSDALQIDTSNGNGAASSQYRRAIVETDRKLYTLLEMLHRYGWEDTAILVTTDHGFHRDHHGRDGGRSVFNTWLAAYNVALSTDDIPLRTPRDYCESHSDPAACLSVGPEEPMPPEDVVPNVMVTSVTPTLLDMFGVEWRANTQIEGVSLYRP